MAEQAVNPRAGRRDAVAVLTKHVEALAERVAALEARYGVNADRTRAPSLAEIGPAADPVGPGIWTDTGHSGQVSARPRTVHYPVPADARPAWQRATVGDRVKYAVVGNKTLTYAAATVTCIADPHNGCRLALGDFGWIDNADIISILPPEPSSDMPAVEAEKSGESSHSPSREMPASLDALKAEYLYSEMTFEEALERAYALGRSERVQADTGDVRERAAGVLAAHTWDNAQALEMATELASAGLLASPAQPAVVKWDEALDLLYKTMRAPLGTASDGLLAVLRSIPGIKIEEA